MGTKPPSQKGGGARGPHFWPIFIVAKRLDASRCHLCGGRPQLRRLCVRWGPSTLSQKGRSPTQFTAHVHCGQTAAWIKMALSTEVGLGLCDIVFDVDPATPEKGHTQPHPIFGPCQLWPNAWMDEDAAWYGRRPRPRTHCTTRGPSSRERDTAAPLFSAHVYCGHGRPCQLLLSSCFNYISCV